MMKITETNITKNGLVKCHSNIQTKYFMFNETYPIQGLVTVEQFS